jgi:hypothetical protein
MKLLWGGHLARQYCTLLYQKNAVKLKNHRNPENADFEISSSGKKSDRQIINHQKSCKS